ncbi:MAG: hypothetical protein H7Y06_06465, partial [Opitutaceae bacterium]|nr:hypothetical protein [Opitutaceae bacterium]
MTKLPLGLAALVAAAFALEGCASKPAAGLGPPPAGSSLAPLVPLMERADGRPIVTHRVEVSGRMIRFQGKIPEATGPLGFLADKAGLRAGTLTLTKEQADAALDALVRATKQDVGSAPKVTVGAGIPARIGIAQELRYPTGWEKSPAPAGGWLATKV